MIENIYIALIVGAFVAYHVYLYICERNRPTDTDYVSRLNND